MSNTHRQQIQVLHVDDDPNFTELIKRFLERENDHFTVETATDADEGLKLISNRSPDCIVSDYNMPGMDGIELLQTVRERYPDLPFILFTGRGSETVASEAIAASVTDYLQKESGAEQYELLANRIQHAVDARREAKQVDRQEQLMRLTELAGNTGGFEIDLDSGDVLLTDGARQLVGLSADTQITFEEAIEFYHTDDQADVRQTVIRAAETGERTRGAWWLRTADGDERLVNVTITPSVESNDTNTVRGAICDITEQRDREQELDAERRAIRQALDTLDDLFYVLNTDSTFRRWNNQLPAITGYADRDLAEMHAVDLFPQGDRKIIRDAIETTLTEGRSTVEADLLTANGECRPYEFTGTQLTDADGNATGLVGIGRALTERRRREQRFEVLIEESNDLVSIVDADGVFQYQCPAIERVLGYNPEETVGDTVWEYIHPDDRTALIEGFERWINSPDATPVVEFRARHTDGSWRWLEARGNNQLDNPAVDGYIINSRDVTDRKRREQELKTQNKRLEEFTSIVSHDLRNPLGVAKSRLELAQDAHKSEHIMKASTAVERCETLIDDLLTLAQQGRQVDETDAVMIAEMAERCWETVETAAATLTVEASQTIEADRSRFQELLENLYRNAVEHGGDSVTISVGAIDDGFYVADTGSGIPEPDRAEIFEAGYSTTAEGTGFGLRIVEQIVNAHEWEIAVTESEHGGARFEITGVKRIA